MLEKELLREKNIKLLNSINSIKNDLDNVLGDIDVLTVSLKKNINIDKKVYQEEEIKNNKNKIDNIKVELQGRVTNYIKNELQ